MKIKFGKPAPSPTTREVHIGILFTFTNDEWDHFAKAMRDSFDSFGVPDQEKVLRALTEIFAHAEASKPAPLVTELDMPVDTVDRKTFDAIMTEAKRLQLGKPKKGSDQ